LIKSQLSKLYSSVTTCYSFKIFKIIADVTLAEMTNHRVCPEFKDDVNIQ